jgi:hypothetical protein
MSTQDASDGDISALEAARNPELLRDRLEGIEIDAIEKTRQVTGDARSHTIGENIRRAFSMRRWSRVLEDLAERGHPGIEDANHPIIEHPRAMLDHMVHLDDLDKIRIKHREFEGLPKERRAIFEWLTERPEVVQDLRNGGTDWFAYGPKGSGKTTMTTTLAVIRNLEINPDAVIWRGSPSRSEWLPLRGWTRLCLPSGVEFEAVLEPPSDDADPVAVDLEKAVWEVVRYDDIRDLNHNVLEEGNLHVVYPDPRFEGADRAYAEADEIPNLEHRSVRDQLEADEDPTPTQFWWFAWAIDKIDNGPPIWTSAVWDEIGNLAPEHASNDYHNLYKRVSAFRNKYVDARRNKFSLFAIGHDEDDLHNLWRKKMRWRVTMNGVDNPTGEVVGMGEAPMNRVYTSRMKLGEALSWNKQNHASFSWSDTPERFKVPGQLHIRPKLGGEVVS